MIPHLFGDRSHAGSRQPKSLCLSQRVTPKTSTSTSGVEAISNDLPLLLIDDLFIEQVFVNLLENAARYTPSGTHVSIQAAIDGKSIRLSVADNGPGFPSDLVGRIFDKFFRATPSADGGPRPWTARS